jgi:hypothetical protein
MINIDFATPRKVPLVLVIPSEKNIHPIRVVCEMTIFNKHKSPASVHPEHPPSLL